MLSFHREFIYPANNTPLPVTRIVARINIILVFIINQKLFRDFKDWGTVD